MQLSTKPSVSYYNYTQLRSYYIIIGESKIQTESLILDSFIPTKELAPHHLVQSFLSPSITWLTSLTLWWFWFKHHFLREVLSDHIVSYHNTAIALSRVILQVFV